MRRRAAIAGVALALAAGCNSGPRRVDDGADPAIYSVCQDPAAHGAWQRAQAALANGDDAAALPELVVVTGCSPDLVRAHLAYQDVARRLGGASEQAMLDFYRRLPAGKTPVGAYCQARLAETAYAQSNALREILVKDPSFGWAHLSLARVTRGQGRFLAALDMYGNAIVNDGSLHEARKERAQVLAELGRDVEAAADYKAYVESRPDDAVAQRDYATLLLYRLGRVDDAAALLSSLEAKTPRDLGVRMDRAAAEWRAGRARASAEGYFAVLRDHPDAVRAALNLGLLYYEVLPQTEVDRQRFWPVARSAFRWFLDGKAPSDGHEQFERTLGVPFRMERIGEMLGPEPLQAVRLEDLRWPGSS